MEAILVEDGHNGVRAARNSCSFRCIFLSVLFLLFFL